MADYTDEDGREFAVIRRWLDDADVLRLRLLALITRVPRTADFSDARELVGYTLVDDSTEENAALRGLHLRGAISSNSAMTDGAESGLRAEVVPVQWVCRPVKRG